MIEDNVITGSLFDAIRLRTNSGLTIQDNILNDGPLRGLFVQCSLPGTEPRVCPTDNEFIGNEMLGNGQFDAVDETGTPGPLLNEWIDNRCVKDNPAGLLCAFH